MIGAGVTAETFDAMTPREVVWRIEALDAERDAAWQRTAQHAAWILNSFGAKVSANKLLGKPEPFNVKAFLE